MQDIETGNLYNTLTVFLQLWKYNQCVNKSLLAGIFKLQRESDYIIIFKCANENEHRNSFEDSFEAIWETLYTYSLVHSAVPKIKELM